MLFLARVLKENQKRGILRKGQKNFSLTLNKTS